MEGELSAITQQHPEISSLIASRSSCLSLPSVRVIGMCYHNQTHSFSKCSPDRSPVLGRWLYLELSTDGFVASGRDHVVQQMKTQKPVFKSEGATRCSVGRTWARHCQRERTCNVDTHSSTRRSQQKGPERSHQRAVSHFSGFAEPGIQPRTRGGREGSALAPSDSPNLLFHDGIEFA